MSANLSFLAGENFAIDDLSGSGLGFYGSDGFGASIRVGEYQGRTFITNADGTSQGPEVDNVKYHNAGSGILGQSGSGLGLTYIPNHQATLNVRFTYDTPVRVVSAEARAYDRSDPNRAPSGVTVKMAEIIHPSVTQDNSGSGDTTWHTPAGSSVVVPLAPSPGPSGLYAGNGSNGNYSATQHDWYLAVSVSPDSIGSKTQCGLYVQVEFL